jgi:hypothetical protein
MQVTVIVSVKINDGIIMASDSASTLGNQIYLTADKIVNLAKGFPIGIMVTGSGSIGSESAATLFKDLRTRLTPTSGHAWAIDPTSYTIQQVAERVKEFMFDEKIAAIPGTEAWMRLRICGYSAGRPLAEVWEVLLQGNQCPGPTVVQTESQFGCRWDGEYDALNRLILGCGFGERFQNAAAVALGIPAAQVEAATLQIVEALQETMAVPAMPVQDAIDLARYMVEVTTGFVRFSLQRQPKSVGGAVEIAAITKHEGFRWVQRRHFYPASLNPPPPT